MQLKCRHELTVYTKPNRGPSLFSTSRLITSIGLTVGRVNTATLELTFNFIINESRCCVIVELYLEVKDAEIESTSRWIGESKSPELIQ